MYLENHISQISCLNPKLILNYCKSLVEYKEGMAYNASCSLRVFLRYLKTVGLVNSDYSYKIPSFAYSRKSKLPSVLTDEELEKMLSSINRSSPLGKRDYAIILMASRLGLRSGDIRKLEFGHIHWENNTIEVITEKTGKTIVLPLLEDVGLAIIDYIKYARPVTENSIIFQTCNAPVKPISASGMSSIVKRAANTASINTAPTRPVGPHTLRSTLASTMLANDVPLPVISGILGHSNTRTTQEYYLRIDKKQLQKCALDVPHFSWDPEEEVF
jgi:integrase